MAAGFCQASEEQVNEMFRFTSEIADYGTA